MRPFVLILFFCLSFLTACYDPIEGCLDVNASNYDLDGDLACGDCCTYPTFELTLLHRYHANDTVFSIGSNPILVDANQDSFRIADWRFLVSELSLLENNVAIPYLDTVRLTNQAGQNLIIFKNLSLANGTRFSSGSVINTIRGSYTLNSLQLTLGLPNSLTTVDPASASDDFPLSEAQNMYDETAQAYDYLRFGFFEKPADTTSVAYTLAAPNLLEQLTIPFSEPVVWERGFNLDVTLEIDYAIWLEGVKVRTQTPEEIEAIIRQNMSKPEAIRFSSAVLTR